MTVKDYLRQLMRIDNEIKSKQQALAALWSQVGIPQMPDNQDRVMGSGSPADHVSDIAIKIAEMEKYLDRKVDRLIDLKTTIMKQIDEIHGRTEAERQTFRTILYCRYVLYMKDWEDVGHAAGYSKSHVIYLHGKALQAFEAQYLKHRTESDQ